MFVYTIEHIVAGLALAVLILCMVFISIVDYIGSLKARMKMRQDERAQKEAHGCREHTFELFNTFGHGSKAEYSCKKCGWKVVK